MIEEKKYFSKKLQENRHYQVYLPESYYDTLYARMCYPVLYLLDGEFYGTLVWEIIKNLGLSCTMPEVILVAINTSEHRFRDLTPSHSLLDWQDKPCNFFKDSGGLTHFLNFLQAELLPDIEASYRTVAHRTLIGHSLGGLAVSYSLLTQPGLFQGLVAIDASLWWQQQHIVNDAEVFSSQNANDLPRRRYYSGFANHETCGPNDLSKLVESNRRFVNALTENPCDTLAICTQVFDNETHSSVCLPGIIAGLQHVFQGHRLPGAWAPDLDTLIAHYRAFSQRMGFDYLPPERIVDLLAWQPCPKLDAAIAFDFLSYNIDAYEQSSHAHSSLGQWYETTGDTENAQKFFQRALTLNAENPQAIKNLAHH